MPSISKSATQRQVEARLGRELDVALRDLYVTQRWTDQEIADHLLVARSTVRTWRHDLGIERAQRRAEVQPA